MLNKITKKPIQNVKHETKVLELIHSDLCDLYATPLLRNKKYSVTFIDDASRFCYVYLLHLKVEALDKFNVFKTEVELQQGSLIKRFKADMGGLSQVFWGEAMLTACYLLNRVHNKRNIITPYELWTKRKPNLNYLRVWGCRAFVRLLDPKLKTLGERGIECIFFRYDEHSKAFRFYVIDPNELVSINSIIESKDAIFDENRFSSVPRPSLRILNGTEDIGGSVVPKKATEELVVMARVRTARGPEQCAIRAVVRLPDPKLKTLGERGIECIFVGNAEHLKAFKFYVTELNESVSINLIIESRDAIFDENRLSSVPRPSLRIPNGTEDIGGLVVPEEVNEEVVKQPEPEIRTCKRNKTPKNFEIEFQLYLIEGTRDEIDSIMGNNTWVLADLPPDYKPFGCKWIFKRKLKVDETIKKFKARLVIQGFRQKSWIDYFDTYAPMDVKTTFLNGKLEEEQTHKQWHQKFNEVVLSNGYLLNQADKCVYSKFDETGNIIVSSKVSLEGHRGSDVILV
ncbi:zinc finger, CCHC-type containing protein [Tanacetum coccineum]